MLTENIQVIKMKYSRGIVGMNDDLILADTAVRNDTARVISLRKGEVISNEMAYKLHTAMLLQA